MQFKAVAISLFLALAAAQTFMLNDDIDDLITQIPSCPRKCLDEANNKGSCDADDHVCQCDNTEKILNPALSCLSDCTLKDQENRDTDVLTWDVMTEANQVGADICRAVRRQQDKSASSSVAASTSSAAPAPGTTLTPATTTTAAASTATVANNNNANNNNNNNNNNPTDTKDDAAPSPTPSSAAVNQAVAGMGMVGAAAMFALAL
ncbi:hypothetical protein GQX73_g10086 [Xylaria multiplex]|uniref:CFEM domain-containing protein n=1 Tax=Xylaria multiplex TaxID=323545 RepID=A0A7C8MIP0_9PEZI|nr:hypothetical protein GQX73_g10086 [Xylaria multiplex]